MDAKSGMIPLNDALTRLVASGEVAPEEAYSKAIQKDGLLENLRVAGVSWRPGAVSQAPAPPGPIPSPVADLPAGLRPTQAEPAAAPAAIPEAPLPSAEAPPAPARDLDPLEDPFEQYKRQRG